MLSRIALADKAAARECIDVYGEMIWAMAKNFTESENDAEKAAQEIFADIWKNAEIAELNLTDEKIWVALIAHRYLNKYSKRH